VYKDAKKALDRAQMKGSARKYRGFVNTLIVYKIKEFHHLLNSDCSVKTFRHRVGCGKW
jgi:hypothetical protein